MSQALKAIYRNGVFIPQTACNVSEGAEVELLIKSTIPDVETKRKFLKSLISRMQQNPIPLNTPHFTRDMLYERR